MTDNSNAFHVHSGDISQESSNKKLIKVPTVNNTPLNLETSSINSDNSRGKTQTKNPFKNTKLSKGKNKTVFKIKNDEDD